MSDLIKEVTPLTRALIWLMPADISPTHPRYKEIDYLVDGLLTATLTHSSQNSHLLMGKSFGRDFYVYCVSENSPKMMESYVAMMERELSGEDRILVVNDRTEGSELERSIPKSLHPRISYL